MSRTCLERIARGSGRLSAVAALVAILMSMTSHGLVAQPVPPAEPSVAERIQRINVAFAAIGARASEGAWQRADAAYNDAVAALDAERPAVEAALGPPSAAAFAEVEPLLADLESALAGEDTARVHIGVSAIQTRLGALAPSVAQTAVPQTAADAVIAWRDALPPIMARARAGQWIDMRNAAIELGSDIERRQDAVSRALAPEARGALDRLRIFAQRLFIAALDQSPSDAEAAAALFDEAVGDALAALGALPGAAAMPTAAARTQFRVFEVRGAVGDIVTVPVIAQALPQIGLGGFDARVRWSPSALRLVNVSWEVAEGRMVRDDAAGVLGIALPQAPTGPTGSPILVNLQVEIKGRTVDGREYLPREEVATLEAALDTAVEQVRLGDLPKAAKALTGAYVMLAGGRDRPDSLYARLHRAGLAEPLAAQLLQVLDMTIRPAEIDRIVIVLADFRSQWERTLDAFIASLTQTVTLPISLDVVVATDTLGAPLPLMPPIDGGITVAGEAPTSAPATAAISPTVPPAMRTVAAGATVPSRVITGTMTAPGEAMPAGAGGSFPPVVIAVIAAVFGLGLAVAVWAARREGEGE